MPLQSQNEMCWLFIAGVTLLSSYLLIFPRVWTMVGDVYLRLGDRHASLQAYDRVLGVWPRLFNADNVRFSRGTLLMSRQEHWEARHVDAEADLRAVLASQPDHASALHNLGLLLSEIDGGSRVPEAVPYLQQGLAIAEEAGEDERDVARRRHRLGTVLLKLGRSEEASRLLLYPHLDASQSFAAAAAGPSGSHPKLHPHAHRLLHAGPPADNEFLYAHREKAVLSLEDCSALIAASEGHAAAHGGWTRGRHEAYPTTDLPLSALPKLSATPAVDALRTAVLPGLVRSYPSLVGLPLYVDDAFVAKYGGQGGAQRMLAFHVDGTPLSFICTLAEPDGGGGTIFRSLLPPEVAAGLRAGDATSGVDDGLRNSSVLALGAGDCLLFAGGALLHGGAPVTAGVRYLLIGFVEVGHGGPSGAGSPTGSPMGSPGHAAYRARWSEAKAANEASGERRSWTGSAETPEP